MQRKMDTCTETDISRSKFRKGLCRNDGGSDLCEPDVVP